MKVQLILLIVCTVLVILINRPKRSRDSKENSIESDDQLGIQYSIALLDQLSIKSKMGINRVSMNIPHEAASSDIFQETMREIAKQYLVETKLSESYLIINLTLKNYAS